MKEKEKFYLSLAAVFVACFLFVWQGVIEAKRSNDYRITEIAAKKTTIFEYDLKEKYLPTSLSNYNFAVNKIVQMRKYFVNDNDLPDFIKTLEGFADKTSNSLEISFVGDSALSADSSGTVDAKKAAEGEKPAGFTLQLDVNGSFENLNKFISYLENMPYYAYINSMNTSIDSKKEGFSIRSVLVIKVFSFDNMSIKGL